MGLIIIVDILMNGSLNFVKRTVIDFLSVILLNTDFPWAEPMLFIPFSVISYLYILESHEKGAFTYYQYGILSVIIVSFYRYGLIYRFIF